MLLPFFWVMYAACRHSVTGARFLRVAEQNEQVEKQISSRADKVWNSMITPAQLLVNAYTLLTKRLA